MRVGELISAPYLAEQRRMHAEHVYGHSGGQWAEEVRRIAQEFSAATVLDYGCGTGAMASRLRRMSNLDMRNYDPAIPGCDHEPSPADVVTCLDVLEHIEPEYLDHGGRDAVLEHLNRLTLKALFVVIATRPAGKTLSDGRNAHLIIESPEWWQGKLMARGKFDLRRTVLSRNDVWAAVLIPCR